MIESRNLRIAKFLIEFFLNNIIRWVDKKCVWRFFSCGQVLSNFGEGKKTKEVIKNLHFITNKWNKLLITYIIYMRTILNIYVTCLVLYRVKLDQIRYCEKRNERQFNKFQSPEYCCWLYDFMEKINWEKTKRTTNWIWMLEEE